MVNKIQNKKDYKNNVNSDQLIEWLNYFIIKGNLSQLETRKILSFILSLSTNMNNKELMNLTISQFKELIDNKSFIYESINKRIEFIIDKPEKVIKILNKLPYLQQLLNKSKEEILLNTIGTNKPLSSSNLQKDINYIAMRILLKN